MIRELLKRGVPIDALDPTPRQFAARVGRLRISESPLRAGRLRCCD